MFKIKFRIVDDFHELKNMTIKDFNNTWKHISGFFCIFMGEQQIGSFYHENALEEDEVGGELLDYWVNKLLDVVIMLNNQYSYIAFKEIETTQRWLEFRRTDKNRIAINRALDASDTITKLLITESSDLLSYVEYNGFVISFNELKKNIICAAQNFLDELQKVNSQLVNTEMAIEITKKISLANTENQL